MSLPLQRSIQEASRRAVPTCENARETRHDEGTGAGNDRIKLLHSVCDHIKLGFYRLFQ